MTRSFCFGLGFIKSLHDHDHKQGKEVRHAPDRMG